jgi:hypothetical protein
MWSSEIASAIMQLQLYMWLMKDELDKQNYPLWKRGYVEIFSQKTGRLLKRVPVEYNNEIEKWILSVRDSFLGLEKVKVPSLRICKYCPRNIKQVCDWYAERTTN